MSVVVDTTKNVARGAARVAGPIDIAFPGATATKSVVRKIGDKIFPSPPEDNSAELAAAEEARKEALRQRVGTLFDAPDATKQFATEEGDLSGALRGQYGDTLKQRYADAERAVRFGAANTGNIGSTTFADAMNKVNRDNELGGTEIEQAVRRSIDNLRSSREGVRSQSIGLINAGAGEEGVRSATAGLKSASENAKAANREQLFNDLFTNLAYTRVGQNNSSQNAQLAAILNRGGGSFFPDLAGFREGLLMAAAIPYLLVAGSAGIAAHSQRDVQKRQQRLIDQMEQYQTGKAREGEASISKFLDTLTPEARAKQNVEAKSELAKSVGESVDTTRAYEKPDNFSGKVSDAYTGRVTQNQATTSDRLKRAMDQLATIGTPGTAGLKQQFAFGRTAGDVDALNAASRNVGSAYEGEIGRVRPKAWEDFLSQLMLGGGLGMAGGTPAPRVKKTSGLYDFGPNVPGAV